jgi:hypothetical protein
MTLSKDTIDKIYETMLTRISECCLPISYWHGDMRICGGTLTVVETDQHIFGITNTHVIDRLKDAYISNNRMRVQIFNAELKISELDDLIIDSRPATNSFYPDLITIRLSDYLTNNTGKKLIPINLTKLEPPRVGDFVTTYGYPNIAIEKQNICTADYQLRGDDRELIQIADDNVHFYLGLTNNEYDTANNIIGCSGGPVFKSSPNSRLLSLTSNNLCGIIEQHESDRLRCVRTDLICSNGMINYY